MKNKIKTFNFGLSNEIETVDLYYIDGYDGLNTMIEDFTEVQPVLNHFEEEIKVKKSEVKIASEIISDIIKTDKINAKKVLKIDTEGAEYKIIVFYENNITYNLQILLS